MVIFQDDVSVVSGAIRDATGKWQAPCHQLMFSNYQLIIGKGYRHSFCDCMECDYVGGTPFMTKTSIFHEVRITLVPFIIGNNLPTSVIWSFIVLAGFFFISILYQEYTTDLITFI